MENLNYDEFPITQSYEKLILGIPVNLGDEVIRITDVVYRSLTREDLGRIRNETLAARRPQTWIVRTLCHVVESIGDEIVYEEFKKGNYKKIPEVVMELTTTDMQLLLLGGHVYNFGSKVPDFKATCPHCQKQQLIKTTLEEMKVQRYINELTDTPKIEVTLPRGKKLMSIDKKRTDTWTNLTLRVPKVADLIKNEEHFRQVDPSAFIAKVYADCMESIVDESGTAMEPERMRGIHSAFFNDMTAVDSETIHQSFGELPRVKSEVELECVNCGDFFSANISNSFLYQIQK